MDHHHRRARKLMSTLVTLGACLALIGFALTDSTTAPHDPAEAAQSQGPLAQVRGVPTPTVPPWRPPPVTVTPITITPITIPPITISPTVFPTSVPVYTIPVPPPPTTVPGVQIPVMPSCQVTTVGGWPSGDCRWRYISFDALYRDIYSCQTGRCYATKFLQIDQAPIVVVYPQAPVERAQARAAFHEDMAYGVKAMGTYLKGRVNEGAAGLPSISDITNLTNRASEEIDSIDQPISESPDQQRRRLGLGSAMRTLARYARDH